MQIPPNYWLLAAASLILLSIPTPCWSETPVAGVESLPEKGIAPVYVRQLKPGPWGDVDYFPLILEPSDFYTQLSTDLKTWPDGTVWRLEAPGPMEAKDILAESGLDENIASMLVDQFGALNSQSGYFEIRPPEEIILGLSADQRRTLYPKFHPQHNSNPFFGPFALPVQGILSLADARSGVHPDLLNLIHSLSYRQGNPFMFADISYVLSKAKDDEERFRILKVVSRERSFAARLHLDQTSNLEELTAYWSSGGRNRDISSILESVVKTKGVKKLDIVHLFPPVPRKLIHTFPSPFGEGVGSDLPDCYWTSYSFFNNDPPDRHLDFVDHVFQERYEKAQKPLQFGDLIMIFDESKGTYVHACNLIADNLVFTKNGKSMGRPWVISLLEDVANSYLQSDKITITFHRLKPQYSR